MTVESQENGRACVGPMDCTPGDGGCPPTEISTTTVAAATDSAAGSADKATTAMSTVPADTATNSTTTTTTTTITTTTLDAAALKEIGNTTATLKESGMMAAELLSKGFTVQELYDGGYSMEEMNAAANEAGAPFEVPATFSAEMSALMESLGPTGSTSSPVGIIVGAVVGALVLLAAGILIGRSNNDGGGVFSKCTSSSNKPIEARISSFTANPAHPQSASMNHPAARPSFHDNVHYDEVDENVPVSSARGRSTAGRTVTRTANPTFRFTNSTGGGTHIDNSRPPESLYDDGEDEDHEFSFVASAAVSSSTMYEEPSRRQAQLYVDGEVPGAADHFAGAAYASVRGNRKAYGDIDGPYDEVGPEEAYDSRV